jgi:hypothetical protein
MTPIRTHVVVIALKEWTIANFGQNGQALHRQPEGEKQMAISVRSVRE